MELTTFQINCEKRLTTALQAVGKSIINRKIDGRSEWYITGNIEGCDITFWIYTDAADFKAPHQHPVYESPDYDSLTELADEFIQALVKATNEVQ